MLAGSTNPVHVAVLNFGAFTNVTVAGSFSTLNNLDFLDDGVAPDLAPADGVFSYPLVPSKAMVGTQSLTLVLRGEDPVLPPDATEPTVILSTNTVRYVVVQAPDNDHFTNAAKLPRTGGTFTGQNRFATLEEAEPFHAQTPDVAASVWWVWTPSVSTNVLVDLAGTSFNAVLAVYRGTNVVNLEEVASALREGSAGLEPWVSFPAIAGLTYRIVVAGVNASEVGDIRGRLSYGGGPDRQPPKVIIHSPQDGALLGLNPVLLEGAAQDDAVDDTGIDRVLVYVNGALQQTATNATWSVPINLVPGTNQISAVAVDIAGNFSVPFPLTLIYQNPLNDDFAAASELPGTSGSTNAINGRASKEPGEPLHAGDEGGHSIWFTWRAPVNGTVQWSTLGSDLDTLLAAYTGDALTNLVLMADNDDASPSLKTSQLSFEAISNVVYYIAVDGYGGASGKISLAYQFTPAPDPTIYLNVRLGSLLGGSIQPGAGLYASNTWVTFTAVPERYFEFVSWGGEQAGLPNPLSLLVTQELVLQATFRLTRYTETFEAGLFQRLRPETEATTGWIVGTEAASGSRGLRSGLIGNGQASVVVIATNTLAGAASFDYSVDSEAGWDFLEFLLNGTRMGRWSGAVPWTRFAFPVPAGFNRFEWRYVKDANFADGMDAAFLDNLYLPMSQPLLPALSYRWTEKHEFALTWEAQPNQDQIVLSSANLVDWLPVSTNRSAGGIIEVVVPASSAQPQQYYKVLVR